jgi:ribosomal protein L21E
MTVLGSRNESLEDYNLQQLNSLKAPSYTYETLRQYITSKRVESVRKLELKIDAKVIFTMNHPKGEYFNGSIGTVIKLKGKTVVVRLENKKEILVYPRVEKEYKYIRRAWYSERDYWSRSLVSKVRGLPLKLG